MPRRLWVVGAVVVAAGAVTGGLLWWRGGDKTSFAWAVGHAPGRRPARCPGPTGRRSARTRASTSRAAPRPPTLRRFLDAAYDDDLSSTSALVTSAPVLQERFGFSPASADWELFSQSDQGAVVMLHLPSRPTSTASPTTSASSATAQPADAGGVWQGGERPGRPDLARPHPRALLRRDRHRRLAGAGLRLGGVPRRRHAGGARATAPASTGLDAVVDDAGEPLSSAVYAGDYACGALAMAHAGAGDQAAAARLLAAAGEVNPYSAFAMSDEPDGVVRVAFEFADDERRADQRRHRATLARRAGARPGRQLRRPVPGDVGDRRTARWW